MFVTILDYDKKYNILRMIRGDHTVVELVKNKEKFGITTAWSGAFINPFLPFIEWKREGKISQDLMKSDGLEVIKMPLDYVLEQERRRLISLRHGKMFFNLCSPTDGLITQPGTATALPHFEKIARCEACSRQLNLKARIRLNPHCPVNAELSDDLTFVTCTIAPRTGPSFSAALHRTLLEYITSSSEAVSGKRVAQIEDKIFDVVVSDWLYIDSEGGTTTQPTVIFITLRD